MYNCSTMISVALKSLRGRNWADIYNFIYNNTYNKGEVLVEELQKLINNKTGFTPYIPYNSKKSCNFAITVPPPVAMCDSNSVATSIFENGGEFFFISVKNFLKIVNTFCVETVAEIITLFSAKSELKCDTDILDLNCKTLLLSHDIWLANWPALLNFIHNTTNSTLGEIQEVVDPYDNYKLFISDYGNGTCNDSIKINRAAECSFRIIKEFIKCSFDVVLITVENFLQSITDNCLQEVGVEEELKLFELTELTKLPESSKLPELSKPLELAEPWPDVNVAIVAAAVGLALGFAVGNIHARILKYCINGSNESSIDRPEDGLTVVVDKQSDLSPPSQDNIEQVELIGI